MMLEKITGKVDENELEVLAGEEVVGGISPTIIAALIAGGVALVGTTLSAGACPSSACTKSCNK